VEIPFREQPEARFKIKRLAMGSVEAGIVDIEVSGPDADRLLALSGEVQTLFRSVPGIRDNDDDWGNKIIKVLVDINQDRIRQLGLTSEEITELMKTYFTGSPVSVYREGDNSIPIVLRAGAETHSSLDASPVSLLCTMATSFPVSDRQPQGRSRFFTNP